MSSFLVRTATRSCHKTNLTQNRNSIPCTRPGHTTRLTRPGHTTRLSTRPGHTTRLMIGKMSAFSLFLVALSGIRPVSASWLLGGYGYWWGKPKYFGPGKDNLYVKNYEFEFLAKAHLCAKIDCDCPRGEWVQSRCRYVWKQWLSPKLFLDYGGNNQNEISIAETNLPKNITLCDNGSLIRVKSDVGNQTWKLDILTEVEVAKGKDKKFTPDAALRKRVFNRMLRTPPAEEFCFGPLTCRRRRRLTAAELLARRPRKPDSPVLVRLLKEIRKANGLD